MPTQSIIPIDDAESLAKSGFVAICPLGPGAIGQRWLFQLSSDGDLADSFGIQSDSVQAPWEADYCVGELLPDCDDTLKRCVLNVVSLRYLDHPNIVQLYRAGELGGLLWGAIFRMHPDTQTLAAVHSRLSGPERLQVMHELSNAVSFLHERGIVHGALNPSSVSLEKDVFKLNDFWWAGTIGGKPLNDELDSVTWHGVPVYTAPFSAPELLLGETQLPTRETDVYSLGAIFYWILSGRLPHSLGSGSDGCAVDLSQSIPLLARQRSDLAQELISLIHRMLDDDPHERPQAPYVEATVSQICTVRR